MGRLFTVVVVLFSMMAVPAGAGDLKASCAQSGQRSTFSACPHRKLQQPNIPQGSELQMTQLQQRLSQRQLADQLAADLLKETNDNAKDIADKL